MVHWNMSTESDLAGYIVYRGSAPRAYEAMTTTLGLVSCSTGDPSGLIPGCANGVPTYLAVTAYDTVGNESTFSAEVSTSRAVPLLTLLRQVT